MKKAVVAACGEGAAALTEFYAGNPKKHCSMVMRSKLDVNKFMELRGQANKWVDPKDQSEHKISTRHDRSEADRDLGQHTSVLWEGVKDAMGLNRSWKHNSRMGTTGKQGTLWVSDGTDVHIIFEYEIGAEGGFNVACKYEALQEVCGIHKHDADDISRLASQATEKH